MIGEALLLLVFAVGVGLVSAGAWIVSPAAGLIVAGLLLIAIVLLERRGRRLYG